MSNYIHTYSGKIFYPLEPKVEDIDINDIAHALSLMTRANGHYKHFYSVAQHSINCYKEAVERGYSKRIQFGCLLHDASEAYLSDITRPVKQNLNEYKIIEKRLQNTIYVKYLNSGLTEEERSFINEIDDCVLYFEFIDLMDISRDGEKYEHFSEFDFAQKPFNEVEQEFLRTFNSFN